LWGQARKEKGKTRGTAPGSMLDKKRNCRVQTTSLNISPFKRREKGRKEGKGDGREEGITAQISALGTSKKGEKLMKEKRKKNTFVSYQTKDMSSQAKEGEGEFTASPRFSKSFLEPVRVGSRRGKRGGVGEAYCGAPVSSQEEAKDLGRRT